MQFKAWTFESANSRTILQCSDSLAQNQKVLTLPRNRWFCVGGCLNFVKGWGEDEDMSRLAGSEIWYSWGWPRSRSRSNPSDVIFNSNLFANCDKSKESFNASGNSMKSLGQDSGTYDVKLTLGVLSSQRILTFSSQMWQLIKSASGINSASHMYEVDSTADQAVDTLGALQCQTFHNMMKRCSLQMLGM